MLETAILVLSAANTLFMIVILVIVLCNYSSISQIEQQTQISSFIQREVVEKMFPLILVRQHKSPV